METIELLTQEETRRRVSIDFTLPDAQLSDLQIPDGVVIPISALSKQPRRNFDMRDESGRAVPVLGRQQNGDLAHIALMNAVLAALPPEPGVELFEMLAADLRPIVFAPRDQASMHSTTLRLGRTKTIGGDRWSEDQVCRSLLLTLVNNYVLYAVVAPGGPNRRVLKYSYGEDFGFSRLR